MKKIWCNKIAVIVDEMSIVNLNFFTIIDLYLNKAKTLHKNLSVVLSELPVIIFLSDFF